MKSQSKSARGSTKRRGSQVKQAEADTVRVLIFQDHGWWVAQCLEYDIGAQAEDRNELFKRLTATLAIEASHTEERFGAAFAGIDRAPQEFFDRWEKSGETAELADPGKLLPVHVSYAEAA